MVRAAAFLSVVAQAAEYMVEVPKLGILKGTDIRPDQSTPFYDGVAQFYGIPYAKPPLGELRFQPPQAYGAWKSPRDASAWGPACIQGPQDPPLVANRTSEDCLTLDVAAPKRTLGSKEKLAVMFWIHGGNYQFGSSSDYSPESLVARSDHSVIVVATQYRLNTFGFLGGAEVQASSHDGSTGTFGIQDQRMAMQWTRDHIGAFGGNGADVTIFGESAGGNSVMNHLAQPESFSLYQRAIMQSGTYDEGAHDMKTAEDNYKTTLEAAGCEDLACLRSLDAQALLDRVGNGPSSPTVDGVHLKMTPWEAVRQGKHNKHAKVIVGSNREEMAQVTGGMVIPDEASFDDLMQTQLGLTEAETEDVKKLYDPSVYPYPANLGNYTQWWWMGTRVWTDLLLGHCGTRRFSRDLLASGTKQVHTYLFAKPTLTAPIFPSSIFVPHAAEIRFAYNDQIYISDKQELELAEAMSGYWVSFSKTDDPNADGLPAWPEFTKQNDVNIRFEDAPSGGGVYTQTGLRKSACDYWDAHPQAAAHLRSKRAHSNLNGPVVV